jgi:hypothetical protein
MTNRWMAWLLAASLLIGILPLAARANESSESTAQGQGYGPNYIAENTRFVVVLGDKLDTRKLQTGKKFKAELGEDLVAPGGQAIARGSRLEGHISTVDSGLHARLLLSFDRIKTEHGWMPLAATVVNVPGEHSLKTDNEGEIQKATMNKTRAAEGTIAGAAAGAGTGALAGGSHGALIGAAVGAAVGGTAAVLTDRNMTLNKGQQLELQLDRPLEVPIR